MLRSAAFAAAFPPLAALFLLAAVPSFRLPAAATTVIAKTFAELASEADLVFVGTVTEVASRWTDAERSSIETVVTFSDLMPLHGEFGDHISLRFAGGEVDGLREEIAGLPRFRVGERVVLFARRERSLSPIVGFHQGCFRVVEGRDGPVVLGCDGQSAPLADEGGALRFGAENPSVRLDEFLDRARRELERRESSE